MQSFNHPNIAKFYGSGTEPRTFMVSSSSSRRRRRSRSKGSEVTIVVVVVVRLVVRVVRS